MFRFLWSPDAETGLAANADAVSAPEGNADPTPAEPTEKPVEPAQEPVDTKDTTKAFAKRLAEETAKLEAKYAAERTAELENSKKAFDSTIAKLGISDDAGNLVTTQEALDALITQREQAAEAAKNNVPPEFYSRLTQAEKDTLETKAKLSQYERKEALAKEAETLYADPTWGEFYKANEQEIRETADKLNLDLGTAKLLVLDKLGVPKVDTEEIANKAIQDYINKKRTFKPVEGSGATPVSVPSTPKTFEEARQGALSFLRAQKG